LSTYPDNVDYSTFWRRDGQADLDPNWTPISGSRSVVERVARRVISIPGDMDDPTYGAFLIRMFNSMLLPIEKEAIAARIQQQALREDGVDTADTRLVQKLDGSVEIKIQLILLDGSTWDLVFELSPTTIPRITLLGSTGS
jgi:hypothetical protein